MITFTARNEFIFIQIIATEALCHCVTDIYHWVSIYNHKLPVFVIYFLLFCILINWRWAFNIAVETERSLDCDAELILSTLISALGSISKTCMQHMSFSFDLTSINFFNSFMPDSYATLINAFGLRVRVRVNLNFEQQNSQRCIVM